VVTLYFYYYLDNADAVVFIDSLVMNTSKWSINQ